jgi:hypothetical protein
LGLYGDNTVDSNGDSDAFCRMRVRVRVRVGKIEKILYKKQRKGLRSTKKDQKRAKKDRKRKMN